MDCLVLEKRGPIVDLMLMYAGFYVDFIILCVSKKDSVGCRLQLAGHTDMHNSSREDLLSFKYANYVVTIQQMCVTRDFCRF